MKKLILALAVLSLFTGALCAEETSEKPMRLEFDLSVFGDSNIINNSVGLDETFKISTFHNRIGGIIGVRENLDFVYVDDNAAKSPINFRFLPVAGVELWNTNLILGFNVNKKYAFEQYPWFGFVSLAYNFNLTKPEGDGFSDSCSLRLGVTWFPNFIIRETEDNTIDAAGIVGGLWSMFFPRLEVGFTYRLGQNF